MTKNDSGFCAFGVFRGLASVPRSFFLPLVLVAALTAGGQTKAAPAPATAWADSTLDQLRQLQHAALEDNYAFEQVAHLADNIGPRPAGSPQAAGAVEYVAGEMRKLGLDVTLEKVSLPRWVRGEEHAELVAYPGQVPGTTQKIVVTALAGREVATPPEGITAEIVVVNSFSELTALSREKVAGKIVVFDERFDQRLASAGFAGPAYGEAVAYREHGRVAAAQMGALAALVRSVGGADFRLAHTGGTGSSPNVSTIPAGAVAAEDADLMARLAAQGPVSLHLVLTSQMLPDVDSFNVIADLKGSEHPEQVVIVSGHLDSWDLGTGAIDDGAGVAIAMEAAQLLKQLHLQPKRTLRVIAWMGEEVGIFGGRAYAQQHAGEVASHFAAIETDMGAGHPMGIYANGDESLVRLLQPVASVLQTSGAGVLRMSDETGADVIPTARKCRRGGSAGLCPDEHEWRVAAQDPAVAVMAEMSCQHSAISTQQNRGGLSDCRLLTGEY
ncbi:MAG: M20/M25/M40 family metallo-hydrolase [Terriglobales bacterium]